MSAFTFTTPVTFGHDSNSNIMKFHPYGVNESETIWYDINSLNEATLDNRANGAGFRLIAEVSRNVIDNTDFDLVETSTNSWPHNSRFDAMFLGNTNMLGLTETYKGTYGGNTYFYKVIWMNNNDNLDYTTTGKCSLSNLSSGKVPALYITNHEFGHLAGLKQHGFTWESDHTAMKPGCHAGMAQLRAEDINDINDYYS